MTTSKGADGKQEPFASAEILSFASRNTFLGCPRAAPDDLGDNDVVILGAPFDWGTSFRPGARFGPQAIRDADYLSMDGYRPHLPTGIDPFQTLGIVDIGDIYLHPGELDESILRIADIVESIAGSGKVPIVLGGDHSITWPDALGVARAYGFGEVALIHFDAHADTGAEGGPLVGHGTPMRRLIESGAVPGHRFVQIGLRGYWPEPPVIQWMKEQRMRSYLMNDIVDRGLTTVVDEAVKYSLAGGAQGVFLSVDIDVVDPGLAPGTGTPEPGGLNSRELLDTVRRLARELRVLGADIVELSPPYDGPGQQTAFLANRVVLEILNGMAERKTAT